MLVLAVLVHMLKYAQMSNRLPRRQSRHQNLIHQKPNDGNSRSCSVTSWTPRNSPLNSTRKTGVTWYGRISRCVRKLFSATMGILLNCSEMGFSSISAIPRHMKMMPKEQYELVWECLLP